MIECREASELRHRIAELAKATTPAEVDTILAATGAALGLPLFGYHLDSAHPSYSDATFEKLLAQGWPRDALELRWNSRGSVLLRLRAPGSLILVDTRQTAKDRSATAQHRAVSALHAKHGINAILGIPVPRPGGRSANVYFGGPRAPVEVDRLISEVGTKLLALGLLALDALEGPVSQRASQEKGTLELTTREWDCLHFLMEGYRDKEIAELTGTKMTTVRYHLDNVVEKLHARNRTHAASIAAHLHWLEVPFKQEDAPPRE